MSLNPLLPRARGLCRALAALPFLLLAPLAQAAPAEPGDPASAAAPPPAAAAAAPAGDPVDLSLEDLLKADVVTASRRAQAVQEVPAAVYLITREDIERSGATSLPEALRLAPGVHVAQLASGRWAVSVRGFNGRFANKLLVLLDGRSVYAPLFSGVLWEIEGVLLDDVERIEVIRGPGAAMWGANAVNGVINIITRKARDTQGGRALVGAGTQQRGVVGLRYGGLFDEGDGAWRVWGRAQADRRFDTPAGEPGNDAWQLGQLGFRSDGTLASGQRLTLSGAVARQRAGDRWTLPDVTSAQGAVLGERTQRNANAHLLARYHRLGDDGSETIAQASIEATRVSVDGEFEERRRTFELDVQHQPRALGRHNLVAGVTLRISRDQDVAGGGLLTIDPARRTFRQASLFVNDEIELLPRRLRLTLGARLEHNNFTGFEPQPQLRLAWTPDSTRTLWAALSRAVRTPSRAERDAELQVAVLPPSAASPLPVLLQMTPRAGDGQRSERVTAFEIGFRQQLRPNLAFDAALFRNEYERLLMPRLGAARLQPLPVPHVVQQIGLGFDARADAWGGELVLDWRPSRDWRLRFDYALLHVAVKPRIVDLTSSVQTQRVERSSPRQRFGLHASWSAGAHDVDVALRHVGAVSGEPDMLSSYDALDLRYAWRATPRLTLSVVGRSLLGRHQEGVAELLRSQPLEVPRSVYLQALWTF